MFSRFFRKPTEPNRIDHWRDFAARLELFDASGYERRASDLLNLPPGTRFGPMYYLMLDEERRLLLFDYFEDRSGPAGTVTQTISVCMIGQKTAFSNVSLRAHRRLDRVRESLGASSSGGSRVLVPGDDDFNAAVTVYAWNEAAALEVLTTGAREALRRCLCERDTGPTFLLGERHMLLSNRAPFDEPTSFEALEAMSSDILSLYAAFFRDEATDAPPADEPI